LPGLKFDGDAKKIVNAALKAKAEVWTFETKVKIKTIGLKS